MPMKKKVLPAVSVNRYYCYQATSLEPPLMVSHEGIQEWKQDAYHQAVSDCSHPQWCTLKGLWMRKPRILAPESWCAYERNDFSEPKLLHLPIHRKVLNSLTWDVWFSLVNSNFLMHWLPGLCCKIPINLGSSRAVLCLATSVMSDSLWPMDCSPPAYSVHGILQARVLERVASHLPLWKSSLELRSCLLNLSLPSCPPNKA